MDWHLVGSSQLLWLNGWDPAPSLIPVSFDCRLSLLPLVRLIWLWSADCIAKAYSVAQGFALPSHLYRSLSLCHVFSGSYLDCLNIFWVCNSDLFFPPFPILLSVSNSLSLCSPFVSKSCPLSHTLDANKTLLLILFGACYVLGLHWHFRNSRSLALWARHWQKLSHAYLGFIYCWANLNTGTRSAECCG